MAKKATGRFEVASPHASFHGLSDTPARGDLRGLARRAGPGAPGSYAMLAPYCFRCPVRHTFPECEIACLDASLELLDVQASPGLAAVITEPLFSAGGVIEPPPGWLGRVAADARARGALFVLDEAQTGLAKLGTMWAFEQEGVVPDIVTVSKHFGGGISISAVVTSEEIEERAIAGGFSYAHSHSNDPLACAAALATLEAIEEERLTERALEIGSRLRASPRGAARPPRRDRRHSRTAAFSRGSSSCGRTGHRHRAGRADPPRLPREACSSACAAAAR